MNNLFNEIVAQHTAKLILNSAIASQRQLLRTIASGKIASAYLFTSTVEGVGKTKTALLFASYICSTTDMLKVHPQEENSTIGVEQVREIITFVSTSPIQSNHKVVIIHDCDTITPTAANALLKTLEEPGKGIFILITSQAQNILPTIKSRCQIVPFAQLPIDEVKTILEKQKIFLHQDILKLCSGSPGRAIAFHNLLNSIPESILDQLQLPPKNVITALDVSNWTSKQDKSTQALLLTYLQANWWEKTKSTELLAKFTIAREQFQCHISTRNVWDNLFIP
ncbi:DNA polymerase III subunit delta' (plasmid) [Brasilonema octagenarum UFV-E1]|uniref:DNA polymerase III subunit delta n=2 Tax=Brasilonema TaxID=383614 RepID=A0A856MQX1_9CYAN|nr:MULTISPECIES: AAA family ATPase [Brasilonema]NMF65945.1 DNA polymerase III subunit delta' [Brasilonema octagenarum UFV-OR1]QDL12714.1 DNA polymerase III subunit delta' [Brasilonema sennae CENA114]QDL19109.1 DNA polymerase III subunit delta' [Brasilonema octagenarum UFV-E1]